MANVCYQLVFFIHTVLVIFLVLAPECNGNPDEDRLIAFLLGNYQKYGRPALEDESVNVQHGLSLLRIMDYCAMSDTVTIEVWNHLTWVDDRLAWSTDDMGGVSSIRLPPSEIWMPDTTPYNAWAEKSQTFNVVVYHDGKCSYVPRNVWKLPCKRTGSTATCNIKLGSWTYDGSKLNLTNTSPTIDLSAMSVTDRFDLEDNKAKREVVLYECCPEPYITLHYNFSLKLNGPLSNSGKSLLPGSIFGSQLLFLGVLSILSALCAL